MCFDAEARPPIEPIAGAPIETEALTLTAGDGAQFAAFLAMPRQPSTVGVVILPDIRGLHTYYEELAVHFAEHGYTPSRTTTSAAPPGSATARSAMATSTGRPTSRRPRPTRSRLDTAAASTD